MSELAYNFYNRILPTSVIFEEPESDLDGFKVYIKSKGYDINYFTEVNKSFDLPYDVTHLDVTNPRTEIKILTHEGLIELSQTHAAKDAPNFNRGRNWQTAWGK